ncbi:hypothetical protein GWK18_00925 [Kocuria sp. JC486]|uniref:hypothetical protein n=1 Tax=Kocuria sp. JC486 TaxID=1970736 RepID=UPI001423C42A|nr:hypothetical protein [Kocuria sp. JC486]NHU84178.1 hypothetical protein [Kocuria sp. JC486]
MEIVLSSVAVVVAVLAFIESRKLRRIEDGRDRRESAVKRRSQAEGLLAWMSAEIPVDAPSTSVIEVQNRTAAPVFDIEVHAIDLNYVDGQRSGYRELAPLRIRMLPPGHLVYGPGKGSYAWDLGRLPGECELLRPVTKSVDRRVVSFSFTDAHGVTWHRDQDGALTEVAG